MRRFTGVLLFAACTRFPSLFVNGLQALHPTVKNHALRRDTVIRGLLDRRQGFVCPPGDSHCETEFCCQPGWECCRDGSCCRPGTTCVVGRNGVIGCCQNGELCSGPVGPPQTVNPPSPTNPPPPPNNPSSPTETTSFFTSTSISDFTTAFTSTSTSTSTSTVPTLLGDPTQFGIQVTDVSVFDITWSLNWVQGTSTCDPSITSKTTSTEGSSFTYIFPYPSQFSYQYFLNVVNFNTLWEVIVDGVTQGVYDSSQDTIVNCTYSPMVSDLTYLTSKSQNITVLAHGSDGLDPSANGQWSLEVNNLLIQKPPPGVPLSSAGQVQSYQPLLVFCGIFLVAIYYYA